MGIKHSSRCMLLRRKMAESENTEVSVRDSFNIPDKDQSPVFWNLSASWMPLAVACVFHL